MNKTLLFLCTGNYYRSRFAEILFNEFAAQKKLNWHANSRGIAIELGINNVGPLSRNVVNKLKERGITLREIRYPIQLRESDLEKADRFIALDKIEHSTLIQQKFPSWVDRIEYWDVPDINIVAADDALFIIEHNVQDLIEKLSDKHMPTGMDNH